MRCPITDSECEVVSKLRITHAIRFLGTGKVMVYGSSNIALRFLHGRLYKEVKDLILEISDEKTKFYYHIQHEDPNQSVMKVEVSRDEW